MRTHAVCAGTFERRARPWVRGRIGPVVAIGLWCGASGCKLLFQADTEVRPDGSVLRTTRYLAFRESDREELEREYALPEGGTWLEEPATPPSGFSFGESRNEIDVYEVRRELAAGEALAPDHVRGGKAARLAVSVHDRVFFREYAFREVFPASADPEDAAAAAEELYALWSSRLGEILAARLDAVSAAEAVAALRRVLDPTFQAFVERVRAGAWSFEDEIAQELAARVQDEAIVEGLLRELPAPSPAGAPDRERSIADAVAEAGRSGIVDDREIEAFTARFFGVYGFEVFQDYGLSETVTLPGEIVATNGTIDGSRVTWEFEPERFAWSDYTLTARSRLWLPGRIAAAAVAGLALAGLALWLLRRSRSAPRDSIPARSARS